MKIAIITINKAGQNLARKLKADFPEAKIFNRRMDKQGGLKNFVGEIFNQYQGLIFIAALGITVRLISGFVKSKFSDPAVVSVDTAGRFAVSALSGHEGGANALTYLAAASLNAVPIVTTGQEVHKKIILGIGTRRGIKVNKVKSAIKQALKKARLNLGVVRLAASVDLKKNESGLTQACRELNLPLVFVSKESIKHFGGGISKSEVVKRQIGLDGVCEPCALLIGRSSKLILKKQIYQGVTVALAKER